jgi:hypothetical protein
MVSTLLAAEVPPPPPVPPPGELELQAAASRPAATMTPYLMRRLTLVAPSAKFVRTVS